jgi:MFS family permease
MNKPFIFNRTNFSYGWVVVGASTLLLLGSYGATLSFGVFLKPLIDEFGWTRAVTSGAMSTVLGISGLVGIMMGWLADKYGARMFLAFGALLGGLGYLLMSDASSLWQLYLYFGVGVGICIGSCYTPISATVSKWFVEKRALALGITLFGIPIGQMLLSPLVAYVIAGYGLRLAYLMLTIVVCISAVPAVILLGRNPPQPTGAIDHSGTKIDRVGDEVGEPMQSREWSAMEAAKTAPFWMLMITGFVLSAGFYFVCAHIVVYATDVGIPVTSAALILTVMSVGGIAGTLLAWSITTRLGNRATLLLLLAAQAVALFSFIWAASLWMFFALAALFGLGYGATTPIRTSMVPQLFGMRSVGTIIGLATFAWAVGGITGPVLAGYVFDLSHSYDMAFSAGGLLIIIGMLAVYFLDGRSG